jgi:hypothetical protein
MRPLRACLLCLSVCCAAACGKHTTFTDAAAVDGGPVRDSDPSVPDADPTRPDAQPLDAAADATLDAAPDGGGPDAPPDSGVPADGPTGYDAMPDSGVPADGPPPTFDGGATSFDAPLG